MEKKFLTEQMGEHEHWYARAAEIRDKHDLTSFIDELMTHYSHDMETVVHAMAAGTLACVSLMNSYPEGEITTAQKHKLMGQFIRRFANMQGPITLIQWLGLLNASNGDMFNTIPTGVWLEVRRTAAELLSEDSRAREADSSALTQQEKLAREQTLLAEEQVQHLKSIQAGHVPWGLKLQQ